MIRRFLGRILRHPPRQLHIPPQPPSERDWMAGDVAECVVRAGSWRDRSGLIVSRGPRRGDNLRVVHLFCNLGILWLVFAGDDRRAYPGGHFRKLRRCEPDFAAQLRAPIREREDA